MAAAKAQPDGWTPAELTRQLEAARRGAPFLVYRDERGEQRIVSLAGVGRLSVGRGPSDVELAHDRAVSWLHAELERIGDAWLVVDDGLSRNGTFVNGERVAGRRRLRHRDLLQIGATTLAYRAPTGGEAEETEAGAHAGGRAATALTATQRAILIALCRPLASGGGFATPATNREIAGEIHLSVDRVKAHLRTLFGRYGLEAMPQNQKRLALARSALELGDVSERELG